MEKCEQTLGVLEGENLKELFKAIKAKFDADGLLKAAGENLYLKVPQNVPFPYVGFFLVTDVPQDTFNTRVEEARVQFSIFSGEISTEEVCNIFNLLTACFDYCALTVEGYGHIEMRRTNSRLMREPDDKAWHYLVEYKILLQRQDTEFGLWEAKHWDGAEAQLALKGLASDGNYLYVGIVDPPSVAKVDLSTRLTVATWTCGEGSISGILSLCLVGGYLYAGKEDAVGANCIFKIDPSDMSQVGAYAYAGRHSPRGLVSDGTYLYVAMGNYAVKIQLSDMTKTAEKYIAGSTLYDIALGGGNLYVISRATPAKVYQINPSTMVLIDTWTGATGQDVGESLVWFGTHIYAGLDALRSVVIRLDPATLTMDGMWQEEEASAGHPCLCTDGNYIFVSTLKEPAKVYAIDENLKTVAEFVASEEASAECASLIYVSPFVFIGLSNSENPCKVTLASVGYA
jgi:hypothetical protein